MAECPQCGNNDSNMLFRPHWKNTHHELICGKCKLEMDVIIDSRLGIQRQLKQAFAAYVDFEHGEKIREMQDQMGGMTQEQLLARLSELGRKK